MKKLAYLLLFVLACILVLLSLSLYSVAQAGLTAQPTRRPPATPPSAPKNEAGCIAADGHWGTYGLANLKLCEMPVSDAGVPCIDSSECQGACLGTDAAFYASLFWPYVVGQCSPTQINYSSMYVEDGRLEFINAD